MRTYKLIQQSFRIIALLHFLAGNPGAAESLTGATSKHITGDLILKHMKVLASDEFEGRAPGGVGEERTVAYLTEQFKALGLKPGNSDGSFHQAVSMIGSKSSTSFGIKRGETIENLQYPQDFVAWSPLYQNDVKVENSELVFVGYGVVAPEYGWDDYKDVDVRGKTIVMLVNDPAVPDPKDPTQLDSTLFKGRAMTYYGRWTYKYEIAAKKGASAALIIHETGPAGYPYFVVINSWGRENFGLKPSPGTPLPVSVAAWISNERARKLFADAGFTFDAMKASAVRRDFKPISLGAQATFLVNNEIREVQSKNVLAAVEGSDPVLRNEWIVFTSHWDHLGLDPKLQAQGDGIFNGAVDNASGTSALLQIAASFNSLSTKPKRSLLFLAVTGEEQGLLGAKHYASHPMQPIPRTVANINIDGLNLWGRTRDIVVVGKGNSTLEDFLETRAKDQSRILKSDAEPEKGFYYRSDHFEFAKVGVPALYLHPGTNFVGQSGDFGIKKRAEYTEKDYHKPSDQLKPDWNFDGAVEDMTLLMQVGYDVANSGRPPQWNAGSEFKAIREESLKKR